ncbi:MAG: hypothetical protein KDA84_08805, partial [Planctomycetaceae bacterium]|nr:hypothetical protein [Planctomycetaceae bacterium]
LYGFFRSIYFQPALFEGYRTWLIHTPWRYGLPLPEGPVRLVLQDGVIVALLSGVGYGHWPELWWVVPCVFLSAYLLGTFIAFQRTEHFRHAYLLVLGLGVPVLNYQRPAVVAVVLVGLYGIAYHGLRDWLKTPGLPISTVHLNFDSQAVRNRHLGWPFDSLGPQPDPNSVSMGWAAALGILVGWWAIVLLRVITEKEFPTVFSILSFGFVSFLGLGRLVKYAWAYQPPISFWGRIKTGRWIIPGYDVIFLAPIVILLLTGIVAWLLIGFRFPLENILPPFLAGGVFVALGFPPNLEEWRMTGTHRIVPAVHLQEMQQLP